MPAFHITTYNKSFGPVGIHNRNSNQNMNKKERTEIKEKQYFEYLRKMAEFRFGITNMSRWRIGSKHENSTKKGYDFWIWLVKVTHDSDTTINILLSQLMSEDK